MSENQKTEISELVNLLYKVAGMVKEKIKEQADQDSLSFSGIRTLIFFQKKGEPTMKEVADYLCVTPPSATSMMNHYVKSGLLERLYDKTDRRIVRLRLTQKGQTVLQAGNKVLCATLENTLSSLSQAQILEFKKILEALSSSYQK
jgi:DNA-binding MarR family transcriptional regulator